MGYSGVGSDVFSSSVHVLMNISHIDERNAVIIVFKL